MHALIIETSTERSFIALAEDRKVSFFKEFPFGHDQSKFLMPALQAAMQSLHLNAEKLDCIGVGIGPGSYTGIRIGAAVAKSLSYVWKIPLVGFSSLQAFIPSVLEEGENFAAIIDAKISGVYFLKGTIINGQILYQLGPQVCALNHLREELGETERLIAPYINPLSIKIANFYPEVKWNWEEKNPSAQQIALVVEDKYIRGEYSSDGRLELLYLRKTEAELEKERKK